MSELKNNEEVYQLIEEDEDKSAEDVSDTSETEDENTSATELENEKTLDVQKAFEEVMSEDEQKKSHKGIFIGIGAAAVILIAVVAMLLVLNPWGNLEKQKVEISETPAALTLACSDENTDYGDLYYKLPDTEAEKVDSLVYKHGFSLMPQTQISYYTTKEGKLFSKLPGDEPMEIATSVDIYSLVFSEDEKTVAFKVERGEDDTFQRDLYIKHIDSEKEKVASDVGYNEVVLSSDGSRVYYTDSDKNFYSWTYETESEKIASNVAYFSAFNDAYAYTTYKSGEEGGYQNSYVKLVNETDAQKLNGIAEHTAFSSDGYAAVYGTDMVYGEEGGSYGELYIYVKGVGEVKVASDVEGFSVSDETEYSKYLYYDNANGDLYVKILPEITEKTCENPDKFIKKFENGEKTKLGNDVEEYMVSDDGIRVIYTDIDKNMYISVNQGEKVKIKSDVESFYSSNERFALLTADGDLYVNNNCYDVEKIKENTVLTASDVEAFSSTDYAQYIAYYCKDGGQVSVLDKKGNAKVLFEDAQAYDVIEFNNKEIYVKLLSMNDFLGKYYMSEPEKLFEILEDGKVLTYFAGEASETKMEIMNAIDKYSSFVKFTGYDEEYNQNDFYCTFIVDEYGNRKLSSNQETYPLKMLTAEEFDSKIEEQKKAEEERLAKEKRKQELADRISALEERAKNYRSDGYYVSSETILYSEANYNSAITDKFTESNSKRVISYSISEDGYTLWLKFRAVKDGNSYYVWVPVK